jgi:hypothetical protein
VKRSGFKRVEYVAPPPAPLRPLVRTPDYSEQPYTNGGRPKDPRIEIPHLMLMARRPQQVCLLRIPGVCPGAMLRDDCCHAHLNGAAFNKGLGLKAHDFFGVRACARCHTWLDSSYSATQEQRQAAGLAGLQRQIAEWRFLLTKVGIAREPVKDREAVALALEHLKARGYVA